MGLASIGALARPRPIYAGPRSPDQRQTWAVEGLPANHGDPLIRSGRGILNASRISSRYPGFLCCPRTSRFRPWGADAVHLASALLVHEVLQEPSHVPTPGSSMPVARKGSPSNRSAAHPASTSSIIPRIRLRAGSTSALFSALSICCSRTTATE